MNGCILVHVQQHNVDEVWGIARKAQKIMYHVLPSCRKCEISTPHEMHFLRLGGNIKHLWISPLWFRALHIIYCHCHRKTQEEQTNLT